MLPTKAPSTNSFRVTLAWYAAHSRTLLRGPCPAPRRCGAPGPRAAHRRQDCPSQGGVRGGGIPGRQGQHPPGVRLLTRPWAVVLTRLWAVAGRWADTCGSVSACPAWRPPSDMQLARHASHRRVRGADVRHGAIRAVMSLVEAAPANICAGSCGHIEGASVIQRKKIFVCTTAHYP